MADEDYMRYCKRYLAWSDLSCLSLRHTFLVLRLRVSDCMPPFQIDAWHTGQSNPAAEAHWQEGQEAGEVQAWNRSKVISACDFKHDIVLMQGEKRLPDRNSELLHICTILQKKKHTPSWSSKKDCIEHAGSMMIPFWSKSMAIAQGWHAWSHNVSRSF